MYRNVKVRRLRRKAKSLSEVVAALKKNDLIESGCETVLQSTFSGVSLAVMKRATPTLQQNIDQHRLGQPVLCAVNN
jgi:hypothetical protein